MQIINLDKKKGLIEVQIEDINDLFVLWNFLRPGDLLEAMTTRKIKFESGESERKKIRVTIEVEKLAFHDMLETLRVGGKIVSGPDKFISLGSYHTIQLKRGMKIKIIRPDGLNDADLEILKEADLLRRLNPIIIVAIERDEATLGVLTGRNLSILGSVYQPISYKGSPNEKSLKYAFFKNVLSRISEILESQGQISGIIIAGPGMIKDEFANYLREKLKIKAPIIVDQASSGTAAGIHEILRRGTALRITQEFRIAQDLKDYEEFLAHLGRRDGLVCYGLDAVEKVVKWGAAKKIFVIVDLINNPNPATRARLLEIIRQAKALKTEIRIISRIHPLYEQLTNFGGIIAFLRYRIREEDLYG